MNKTLFFLTILILLSCSDNQSNINVDEIVKKANAPLLNGLGNHSFKISVSHTTRPPRSNEVNGVDYLFVSMEKFKELID